MPVIKRKFKSLLCYVFAILTISTFMIACQRSEKPNVESEITSKMNPSPTPIDTSTPPEDLPAIVAFGDSLTAGFGLPPEQTFPVLLQRKINEKGYRYQVKDAGVSGDTSAGGLRRLDWVLQGNVKFLILELGANDGLRGQPVAAMKKNLAEIIERAQARRVTVILAGMEAPQNMGEDYTIAFRQAYRDLAKQYNIAFIPFLLEGIGGRPEFNQPDGIHPNTEGERLMTENVWRVLEPLLKSS